MRVIGKFLTKLVTGVLATGLLLSCRDERRGDQRAEVPGNQVTTDPPANRAEELAQVQAQLDAVAGLDAASFAQRYAVPFSTSLGYDPLAAKGLELVDRSTLSPSAAERSALARDGFVISGTKQFPSFVYGYQTIYQADLPVYISADSILFAVHKSYDAILESIERASLRPAMLEMVKGMRTALAAGAASKLSLEARKDADVYLAVGLSLLEGSFRPTVVGGDAALAKDLFEGARASDGTASKTLFGTAREIDFSQFRPRGHYAGRADLETYFRATMWFGRIDFRILETLPNHTQVFRRNQLEAAYVLRALMEPATLARWARIDAVVGAFVGEPDNMTVPQLDALLVDLGLSEASALATLPDSVIAQAMQTGAYGAQRISSHIMQNGLGSGTMPLSSTFLLLGQRYVVDSHVFSNVVYDRAGRGEVQRMMPNPLDVGFAALANDQAGLLLASELTAYAYAPDLASMRVLVDAHPPTFWEENLYNGWLSMIRSLSPTKDVANPPAAGLPRVAGTEAWGRRLLSAQLASWAELRHDTVLYAKQSYTGGSTCEYPDAYVEPYPELFAKLGAYAARAETVITEARLPAAQNDLARNHFRNVRTVAATLEAMAKNQRAGSLHTPEQMEFVNRMVFSDMCGSLSFDGWYAKLFFHPSAAPKFDPTIADVHTQPTSVAGAEVGRVLHVGTGMPRTMIVTVDGCSGPRAYVGLASSYHERITDDYLRLDDQTWAHDVQSGANVADVPWMSSLVVR